MARFSASIIDIVNENEDNTQQTLFEDMEEFPCLFNITNCKLDVGIARYAGMNICEPDLSKNKLNALQEDIEYDNEDSEFEDAIWKENLLTFVFAELGTLKDALRLNKEIHEKHGMNNLVTLANAAFLFYRTGNFSRAQEIIGDLRELKSDKRFLNLKMEAVSELGYAFRKFGGAKNLLCSISLLEFSLSIQKNDERLQFMLAMVYRRCIHFNIYTAEPKNINRHDCALKAAKGLSKLGISSKNIAIKAAALIELAYCKYNDDINKEKDFTDEQNYLSKEEWCQIVQKRTWREICEEAINVSGDNPTEKVLKMAGQLYRYGETDEDLKMSEEFLIKAIKIKPSNRAHHHLGLTYRKMAVKFVKRRRESRNMHRRNFNRNMDQGSFKYNRDVEVDEGFKLLPAPPLDNSPRNLDNHLKYITRVPSIYLMLFSKDNIFTGKAITQFKKAAEVSHYQNRPAVYDLAYILAQTEQYDESKQLCMKIISELTGPKKTVINFPVYLVNAHNLYGVCCAKQAEIIGPNRGNDKTERNRQDLLAESEKHLILAVRYASILAADIPELTLCATDLWNAFRELEKKFTFEGQKESREKLFKICEFVHDYRYLQAVEEIIQQDPTELEKITVIEQCLRRYLKMKAFDSALLFRDLIILRPAVKTELLRSKVYKQLMLEVAEGKLSEVCTQVGREVYHPDPIWKQLFNDELQSAGSCKKYEIVIAEDITDDYEPKMCNINSNNLRLALQQTFSLNVVSSHEEGYPGALYLEEQLNIISNASVAIFIVTAPCLSSLSLELGMACLSVSGSETSVPESAAVNTESAAVNTESAAVNTESAAVNTERTFGCPPEGARINNQSGSENSLSRMYETIINISISNFLNKVGSTRMMLVVPDSLEFKHLPQAVRDLPHLALSQVEIETLAAGAQRGSSNEQFINLMKKIFHVIVGMSMTIHD